MIYTIAYSYNSLYAPYSALYTHVAENIYLLADAHSWHRQPVSSDTYILL